MRSGIRLVLLGFLLLGLWPCPASAQAMVPERSYSFGTLLQGERVEHRFVIRNAGLVPLRIDAVLLSAPGAKARFTPSVAPGRDGFVTLEWNTSSVAAGEAQLEAEVQASDPQQPAIALLMKGTLRPRVEFSPMPAVFFSVYRDEIARETIRIVNNESRPLKIETIEPDGRHFLAELKTVTPGREYLLEVTTPPGMNEAGRYREGLWLSTDHPELARLRVGVNVLVKDDVYLNPDTVDFGEINLEEARNPELLAALTQTLFLKARRGTLRITSITSDIPALLARSAAKDAGPVMRLEVGLSPEKLRPGPLSGTIRIQTSDKKFPEFTVPVRGQVR